MSSAAPQPEAEQPVGYHYPVSSDEVLETARRRQAENIMQVGRGILERLYGENIPDHMRPRIPPPALPPRPFEGQLEKGMVGTDIGKANPVPEEPLPARSTVHAEKGHPANGERSRVEVEGEKTEEMKPTRAERIAQKNLGDILKATTDSIWGERIKGVLKNVAPETPRGKGEELSVRQQLEPVMEDLIANHLVESVVPLKASAVRNALIEATAVAELYPVEKNGRVAADSAMLHHVEQVKWVLSSIFSDIVEVPIPENMAGLQSAGQRGQLIESTGEQTSPRAETSEAKNLERERTLQRLQAYAGGGDDIPAGGKPEESAEIVEPESETQEVQESVVEQEEAVQEQVPQQVTRVTNLWGGPTIPEAKPYLTKMITETFTPGVIFNTLYECGIIKESEVGAIRSDLGVMSLNDADPDEVIDVANKVVPDSLLRTVTTMEEILSQGGEVMPGELVFAGQVVWNKLEFRREEIEKRLVDRRLPRAERKKLGNQLEAIGRAKPMVASLVNLGTKTALPPCDELNKEALTALYDGYNQYIPDPNDKDSLKTVHVPGNRLAMLNLACPGGVTPNWNPATQTTSGKANWWVFNAADIDSNISPETVVRGMTHRAMALARARQLKESGWLSLEPKEEQAGFDDVVRVLCEDGPYNCEFDPQSAREQLRQVKEVEAEDELPEGASYQDAIEVAALVAEKQGVINPYKVRGVPYPHWAAAACGEINQVIGRFGDLPDDVQHNYAEIIQNTQGWSVSSPPVANPIRLYDVKGIERVAAINQMRLPKAGANEPDEAEFQPKTNLELVEEFQHFFPGQERVLTRLATTAQRHRRNIQNRVDVPELDPPEPEEFTKGYGMLTVLIGFTGSGKTTMAKFLKMIGYKDVAVVDMATAALTSYKGRDWDTRAVQEYVDRKTDAGFTPAQIIQDINNGEVVFFQDEARQKMIGDKRGKDSGFSSGSEQMQAETLARTSGDDYTVPVWSRDRKEQIGTVNLNNAPQLMVFTVNEQMLSKALGHARITEGPRGLEELSYTDPTKAVELIQRLNPELFGEGINPELVRRMKRGGIIVMDPVTEENVEQMLQEERNPLNPLRKLAEGVNLHAHRNLGLSPDKEVDIEITPEAYEYIKGISAENAYAQGYGALEDVMIGLDELLCENMQRRQTRVIVDVDVVKAAIERRKH